MTRLVAWVFLLMTGAYLVAVAGTVGYVASVQGAIATQVLAMVVLGGWLVLALLRPAWRPTSPLVVPVLAAAGAYALSGALSQRPRLSLEPTIAGLGFALAFLFLTRLLSEPWFRNRVGPALISGVTLLVGAYLIQVVATWIEWWGLIGGFAMPILRPGFADLGFGSPNTVAALLLITAPLAVALVRHKATHPSVATTLAVVAVVALVLTGSRGALLGVGIAVAFGLVLAGRPRLAAIGREVAGRLPRTAAIFLGSLTVVAVLALVPVVARRFAQGGDSLRLDLWRSALTIFVEHPLTGGGPGTWAQLKIAANPIGATNVIEPHAHNVYLQTAAELGLVGLAALIVLAIAVAWRIRTARAHHGPFGDEATAVLLGLVAFAGHGLVENSLNLPAIVIPLLVVVAWVDGGLEVDRVARLRSEPTTRRFGRESIGAFAAIGLLAAAAIVLFRIDRASLTNLAGNDAAFAQNWAAALASYDEALAQDPDHTLYQLERAGALARLGRLDESRRQLNVVVQQDPTGVNLTALAALDLALGDLPTAIRHADQALESGPNEPTIALNAGIVAEAAGDRSSTLERYADAVRLDPPLARSAFWSDGARTVTKAEVIEAAATRTDPLTGALIRAYGGDTAAADAQLSSLPPSRLRDTYAAVSRWLGGDSAGATSTLLALALAEPQDWVAAAWLARVARLSGDPTTARRAARWANIDQADAADSIVIETSRIPADPTDPIAGLPLNYPWAIYLRPAPPFLLPPQVTTIGLR